jgi:ATP-dependent Lon protease
VESPRPDGSVAQEHSELAALATCLCGIGAWRGSIATRAGQVQRMDGDFSRRMPITIGRSGSIAAAQQALRDQRQVGILMQRSPDVADPAPIDMHRLGSVANIVRYITGADGTNHLICQGDQRFQVLEFLSGWPFLVAYVLRIPEPDARSPEIEAHFLHLKTQATEASQLLPQMCLSTLTESCSSRLQTFSTRCPGHSAITWRSSV